MKTFELKIIPRLGKLIGRVIKESGASKTAVRIQRSAFANADDAMLPEALHFAVGLLKSCPEVEQVELGEDSAFARYPEDIVQDPVDLVTEDKIVEHLGSLGYKRTRMWQP